MQSVNRVFQALFSAVVLSVALGCAGTSHKESTGEYVDDSWITSKVKAAFVNDKTLGASEINVETFKGTVQLSGFVNTRDQKSRAGDLAKKVEGVRNVENNITVKD